MIKIVYHDGQYIINELSVAPMHKKKGIGTFLINSCENFIKALKGDKAILYVKEGAWQENWYKRLGYTKSKEQDGYIKMEKKL
jgi:ribosomal protein S18 acetylase RimI-like enzyme